MCSSQNETKIPTPPKHYSLDELINGMKRLSNNIKQVLSPNKPKRVRDLSELQRFKWMNLKRVDKNGGVNEKSNPM